MAYKFTNVYDVWMPLHLMRICSAIDELPSDINFDLSQVASFSQSEPQSSQQSNAKYTEMLGEDDSQPSVVGSQKVTPTTSFTETTERASKKLRSKRAACLKWKNSYVLFDCHLMTWVVERCFSILTAHRLCQLLGPVYFLPLIFSKVDFTRAIQEAYNFVHTKSGG